MRVLIHTFGCQMNKLDSELVAEALTAAGHELVAEEEEAEVILFNTCSVRDHAEERVLQRLRQLKARKEQTPGMILGLLGCQAQRMGEELFAKLPHLDLVCGTRQFPRIAQLIEQASAGPVLAIEEVPLTEAGVHEAHARGLHQGMHGYISVMRGCNNFCAYCIVPYVRGREESRPIEAIVTEAQALVEQGAREIMLLGQNIDAYGKDIDSSLCALLHRVHAEVPGALRIRFVTSHPRDITRALVETMQALPRVCNHLHMPAQSGSTRVLAAMKRGYTREEYDAKLAMIAEVAPGTLITSDFIVGFPTETAAEFEETLDLVKQAGFQTCYIFKYSPRPGTLASKTMPDDISQEEKKRRNQALLAAQEAAATARGQALIGTTQEILVAGVSQRDDSRMSGRTTNNQICVFAHHGNPELYTGTLVNIKITDATALTLYGALV